MRRRAHDRGWHDLHDQRTAGGAEDRRYHHDRKSRRARLQDALQALETGLNVHLAALAQHLGYFDQAHFTRDFKRITGATPGRY
jgi:AraC-like DNA-binding protein